MSDFHVTSDAFRAASADPVAAVPPGGHGGSSSREISGDAGAGEPADGAPGVPSEAAGLLAERERLARQLRDTRMQLAMTQQRLTALQQSATMALGKTLVNAAKRPWPRGAQLPRDLYRMWRDRGAPGKSGGATLAIALAAAQLNDLKGTGGRFLSQLTPPGAVSLNDPALLASGVTTAGAEPARLVITGALTPLGCATLAPDAIVHPLLPHDADIVIEATGADLVLIEAAALLPGSPWAYATDPAGADRGRRLARMIVMARSLGKPVALIRNVPPALLPGLGWVAASCDVVTDDGLGVQLARFNPVGLSATRPAQPLYAGERDPRESPSVRALLDGLTADPSAGLTVTGARSWRELPELYRSSATFVTASADQAREQLACGARVIGLRDATLGWPPGGYGSPYRREAAAGGHGGSSPREAAAGGHGGSSPREAAAALASQLSAAATAAPPDGSELRARLRGIFAEHATPVRLAALARSAGLGRDLIGGRQIAVLATLDDAAQASRLAGVLLGQRLRPAEVIARVPGAAQVAPVRDALSVLADADIGIQVTVDPGSREGYGGASPREIAATLASLASSPWVAPWPAAGEAPPDDAYLLDLACARECAQADAVGFGPADYEFTRSLATPALARRELFLPGSLAPDSWGPRGLRLITLKGAH